MAQSNVGKFDKIYKFLSEHHFEMDKNVPDKLKCENCHNILNNPCQGPCLCKFCSNCIDELMRNGIDQCPGNKNECQNEKLSNFVSHFALNFKISKLVLKCPEELCGHECQLMDMEEHLRLCSNKSIACPFYGFGCDDDKLVGNEMVDHLQLEGLNHNKILFELIENLRNEVNVLKGSDETNKQDIQRNKNQIEILIENCRIKDETITGINGQIQRHKTQIEILQENSLMKDQTISVMQQQIRSIKDENQQMAAQINNLQVQSDNKIANLREEMTKKWSDNLGTDVRKMNDDMQKWQLQLTKRTDEVEKWQDKQIDGTVVMKVDKISVVRKNGARICSPIFYPRISPYKMQLVIMNIAGSDELKIQLCIHAGEMDAVIKWPFKGNVTIQISNKAHPNVSNTITKSCQIDKPNNNSFKYNDPVSFSYSKLSTAGLIQNDYFIVECHVE